MARASRLVYISKNLRFDVVSNQCLKPVRYRGRIDYFKRARCPKNVRRKYGH
jgi:hypothetical protein